MSSNVVGTTILQQLGGRRFQVMTGAKHFVAHPDGLSFKFPRHNGVNFVRITLTPADTYDVKFFYLHAEKSALKQAFTDIYWDQLEGIFTRVTGLRTSLTSAPNFKVNVSL